MKPITIDIDVADEDTDGYANNDASGNGGAVTLAVNTPTDGLAHKVVVTPSGSVTGNYTLVGTDADGKSISETLATDTINAVTSAAYFKTLTSMTNASGVGAETIDVGWADEVASKTYPLDVYLPYPPTVQANVTGTLNFDIEITNSDITTNTGQNTFIWANEANFTGKSADLVDDLALPGYRAMRVVLNSYSSGAELQLYMTFPY